MLNTQTHTLDVSTRGHICRNPSLCRFLAGNGCESRMKPQGAAFGEELLCRGEASGNFWPPAVAPGPTAALQHSVFRAAASRNHGQDQNSSCRHFSNFSPLLRVLCIFQCCFFFFFLFTFTGKRCSSNSSRILLKFPLHFRLHSLVFILSPKFILLLCNLKRCYAPQRQPYVCVNEMTPVKTTVQRISSLYTQMH